MKTREERIEKLEREEFFLEMKDYWTEKDFRRKEEITKELKELKEAK